MSVQTRHEMAVFGIAAAALLALAAFIAWQLS